LERTSPRRKQTMSSTALSGTFGATEGGGFVNKPALNAALEEKRRVAHLERQRVHAARESGLLATQEVRIRSLLAMEREAQVKREQEAARLEAELERDEKKERKRAQVLAEREKLERLEAAEKGRLEELSRRREAALALLENQRRRAAEEERIRREALLAKRREMLRVQEAATAHLHTRREEEQGRQRALLSDMEQVRQRRLDELARRRADPVLQAQAREFTTLMELQGALHKIAGRLEAAQLEREAVREQLLETRHRTAQLEGRERALTLSVDEAALDLSRMRWAPAACAP
jgi:hypothetical protein